MPSLSILAEPSVAVVDKVVLRRGTREIATEYLNYLYSKEGREIVAKNYYRPRDADIAAKYASQYPQLKLVTIKEFGGWAKAQSEHASRTRACSIRSQRSDYVLILHWRSVIGARRGRRPVAWILRYQGSINVMRSSSPWLSNQ